jgi:hypothetical protein
VAAKLGTPQALAAANALQAQLDLANTKDRAQAAAILGLRKAQQKRPGAPAATSGAPPPATAPTEGILHSGASNMFQGLQFVPQAQEEYPALAQQYTNAQQADKALSNLDTTFDTLTKNAGVMGKIESDVGHAAGHLPFGVGEFVHGPVKFMTQGRPEVEKYNSAKTALLSDLTNAFKGTNVSGADIQRVVDDNAPMYGDTPDILAQKKDAVKGFIKRSVPTSLLDKYHLTQ